MPSSFFLSFVLSFSFTSHKFSRRQSLPSCSAHASKEYSGSSEELTTKSIVQSYGGAISSSVPSRLQYIHALGSLSTGMRTNAKHWMRLYSACASLIEKMVKRSTCITSTQTSLQSQSLRITREEYKIFADYAPSYLISGPSSTKAPTANLIMP